MWYSRTQESVPTPGLPILHFALTASPVPQRDSPYVDILYLNYYNLVKFIGSLQLIIYVYVKSSVTENLKRENKKNQMIKTLNTWCTAGTQFILWEWLTIISVC